MPGDRIDYYPVRVSPQKEAKVAERIIRRGNATLFPIEYKWRRVSAHGRWREKKPYPLFSRYLFVALDGWDDWRGILADLGKQGLGPYVQGLVSLSGTFKPLPAHNVRFLSALPTLPPEGQPSTNVHKALVSGGMAEIVEGPFAGQTVRVDTVARRECKVLLQVLDGMRLVRVPITALEAV